MKFPTFAGLPLFLAACTVFCGSLLLSTAHAASDNPELPSDPLNSVMWQNMAQRFFPGEVVIDQRVIVTAPYDCLLYTSPSPRDRTRSRMPSSA